MAVLFFVHYLILFHKVAELIKVLKEYDDDTLIVMSSDAEGNSYSPLSSFCEGYYAPENTWSGTFFTDEDIEDDEEEEIFDEEMKEKAIKCLVIWPIN